jgi:hypothetical protein
MKFTATELDDQGTLAASPTIGSSRRAGECTAFHSSRAARPEAVSEGDQTRHPAVTSLVEGAALMERIAADRPRLIIDALLGGVTPREVTAALGWDVEDLRVAMNKWAPQLRRAGQLSEQAYAAVTMAVWAPR